jgi:translation initiation factor IF-2
MAKIRVYELARELKVESKKLVDELNAGGLQVKNYMSTLDEEMTAKARKIISGAVSEVVVEKRVKPRVIRRRKKIIQVEKKPVDQKDELPGEAESVSAESVPEKVQEAPVVEKAPPPTPVEREKPEVTAKTETAVPPAAEAPKAPEEETPPRKPKAPAETVAAPPEKVPEVPEEPAAAKPEEPQEEPVETPVSEPSAEEPPRPETSLPEETPPDEEKTVAKEKKSPAPEKPAKVKGKKAKKRKSDKPAKIISPPEEGPLKNILARETETKRVKPKVQKPKGRPAATAPDISGEPLPPKIFDPMADDGKPSKKKKGWKKDQTDDTVKKGVIKRKKKEVYERADLYQDRGKKHKGKKGGKKTREVPRKFKQTEITTPKAIKRRIKVQETVTVTDLAKAMGTKATELLKRLMKLGVMANINQSLDFDTASLVADELGFELELDSFEEEQLFCGCGGQARRSGAETAGGDHYGPCGSRQNLPARLYSRIQHYRRGIGRYYPAHRGILCEA